MNAPMNDAVRQALENVTLDDKPLSGLQHIGTEGCAADRGGFGVLGARGGVV